MTRHFMNLLKESWEKSNSLLCVGLDPEYSKIPVHLKKKYKEPGEVLFQFNKAIIDATKEFVCAFKPQSGFFESPGEQGIQALKRTVAYIHETAPELPVLLDAKRADIGSTSEAYGQAIFDYHELDAVTLQPYLGSEALAPLLARENKGLIILCRTSNPGSGELQDLAISLKEHPDLFDGPAGSYGESRKTQKSLPLYEYVALRVANHWNMNNNCLLVVGATYPTEMKAIRELVGDMPFLVPGIGAQGGDIEATVKAGMDSNKQGMIINSARGVIFASNGEDFAQAAAKEAKRLYDVIN